MWILPYFMHQGCVQLAVCCMRGTHRQCYDFNVLNESVVAPVAPCCHGNEAFWYVRTWFVNIEIFSAIGVIMTGKQQLAWTEHKCTQFYCYSPSLPLSLSLPPQHFPGL